MIRDGRDGHGNVFVGERRTSDGAQSVVAHEEFVLDVQALANRQKGLPLAVFGALSVAHV
jgi:hypothetical protein